MSEKIKLAIVDDDKLVVQLLSEVFDQLEGIKVVLQAYSGNDCLIELKDLNR